MSPVSTGSGARSRAPSSTTMPAETSSSTTAFTRRRPTLRVARARTRGLMGALHVPPATPSASASAPASVSMCPASASSASEFAMRPPTTSASMNTTVRPSATRRAGCAGPRRPDAGRVERRGVRAVSVRVVRALLRDGGLGGAALLGGATRGATVTPASPTGATGRRRSSSAARRTASLKLPGSASPRPAMSIAVP